MPVTTFDISGLSQEIFWDETFEIGATTFRGRVRPDDFAARAIVQEILKKSGAEAMMAALASAELEATRGLAEGDYWAALSEIKHSLRDALAAIRAEDAQRTA